MSTSMDIAVLLDCSSSIAFYIKPIRSMILSILRKALMCHQSDIRMALIEFQTHSDYWVTNISPFTSSIDTFQEWIAAVQLEGGRSDESKAIVDALDASLSLDWRPNNNVDRYHEKLVILITDGPPCNLLSDECPCYSKDLWHVIDEFEKQLITLAVVGIEPGATICDDFYCALANKTGGEYLPLINAPRVLSSVIQRAILEEDTLSQLFRHLDMSFDIEYNSLYHYSSVRARADFMMNYCRTLADIRKWLYTYRDEPIRFAITPINIDFEPHSPSSHTNYFYNYFLGSNENINTSTPVTDDEGYRTRLPTTASADSSFIHINSSPVLPSHRVAFEWSGDSDDGCF